eukprot:4773659-Pleurochrysis_carterae.AAC.1
MHAVRARRACVRHIRACRAAASFEWAHAHPRAFDTYIRTESVPPHIHSHAYELTRKRQGYARSRVRTREGRGWDPGISLPGLGGCGCVGDGAGRGCSCRFEGVA